MTVCSSTHRKKRKLGTRIKIQGIGAHDEFINRITKTLYYGNIPLTEGLSLPVTELASEIFSEVKKECSLDRLHVDQAAEISRNACVSPCSLVLALLYLERLKTTNTEYVEKVSPSDLFLVSMMVASKFLHDDGEKDEVFNDEWAASGGIDLKEMNLLEKEFLNAINWEVYVSERTFWTTLHSMEATLALREGMRRGWFSYTELDYLAHSVKLLSLAHTFITMSAVCLTGYTVSVLAILGSTMVVSQLPTVASSLAAYPAFHLTTTLGSTVTINQMSPITSRSASPLPLPDICHSTSETALYNLTSLDCVRHWPEKNDTNNYYLEAENNLLVNLDMFFMRRKDDWTGHKYWLTPLTQLAQVASVNIRPPVVLLY